MSAKQGDFPSGLLTAVWVTGQNPLAAQHARGTASHGHPASTAPRAHKSARWYWRVLKQPAAPKAFWVLWGLPGCAGKGGRRRQEGRRRRLRRRGRAGPGALRVRGRRGPRRGHAVPGAGHERGGGAAAGGAAREALRRRRRHPGQARGAGVGDGAARAAHGGGGLGGALRAAARLLHRRGGLGGAEPRAQRPPLRLPHGRAGPRRRADCHPLLPAGALADWQEQNCHDFPVILQDAPWNKAVVKT